MFCIGCGVTVPLSLIGLGSMNVSVIPFPGDPISDTVFFYLADEILDPVVYTGNWSRLLGRSATYTLSLPEPRITVEFGRELATEFVDTRLKAFLEESPDNPEIPLFPVWHYGFQNGTTIEQDDYSITYYDLYVSVSINPIQGKVSQYYESWSKSFYDQHPEFSSPLYPNSSSIEPFEAEAIAAEYLNDHNYTLPVSARLLDTRLEYWPYNTELNDTDDSTFPVYVVELGIPKGRIYPPKWLQGPRLVVNAVTGRVQHFMYQVLDIPEPSTQQIVDVSIARETAIEYFDTGPSNWSYSERRVFLRLQGDAPSIWEFCLAWSFEVMIPVSWGSAPEEILVNAYTGLPFSPPPMFAGGYALQWDMWSPVAVILITSSLTGYCGYRWALRRTRPM